MDRLKECAAGARASEFQVLKCAALAWRGNHGKGFSDPDQVAKNWYSHYLQFGLANLPPFVHEYLSRTLTVVRASQHPVAA